MAPEVRVSGPDNEPLGVMTMVEALRLANEMEVDVVEIAATAVPPVVRLMDYGKFKYQEQKKEHEAKLKQNVIEIKEIKFRPGTDDGDYNIKMRNIRRFLEDGDKVKVTLRFRGREITHQEIGMALLVKIKEELAETIIVESMPKLEGRQMIMMIAPGKKKAGAAKAGSNASVNASGSKAPAPAKPVRVVEAKVDAAVAGAITGTDTVATAAVAAPKAVADVDTQPVATASGAAE